MVINATACFSLSPMYGCSNGMQGKSSVAVYRRFNYSEIP